jgi:hypothetical protein
MVVRTGRWDPSAAYTGTVPPKGKVGSGGGRKKMMSQMNKKTLDGAVPTSKKTGVAGMMGKNPERMAAMKNKRALMSADSRYKPNKSLAKIGTAGAVVANRTPAMMKQIKEKRIAEGGRGRGAYARAGGRPTARTGIRPGTAAAERIASAMASAAPKETPAPAPVAKKPTAAPFVPTMRGLPYGSHARRSGNQLKGRQG